MRDRFATSCDLLDVYGKQMKQSILLVAIVLFLVSTVAFIGCAVLLWHGLSYPAASMALVTVVTFCVSQRLTKNL